MTSFQEYSSAWKVVLYKMGYTEDKINISELPLHLCNRRLLFAFALLQWEIGFTVNDDFRIKLEHCYGLFLEK